MVGRIETYMHSDSTTANKGGALIRVLTQSDFAARTEGFIAFCRLAARICYAAEATTWQEAINLFPEAEQNRVELQAQLRETIHIDQIAILHL